jgi:molybdate transport system substrate-binding protein
MNILRKVAVFSCLLLLALSVRAQELRVAAAADLQFAMKDLAVQFENKTGTKVVVSYGSSGNFGTQIQNGAPFDLFFSADVVYAQQLVSAEFADPQSFFVYAQGHLVLWAPANASLGLAGRGFEALKDPRVQKIAVANPEHAPYGRAAIAALQKAKLYDQVKSKLVYGDNISQAAQFAQSGSAQVGIIALSLTFAESMKGGERWEIPTDLYPPIQQAAVIIRTSSHKAAANAFLEFVKSDEGRKLLSNYGFTPPQAQQKP